MNEQAVTDAFREGLGIPLAMAWSADAAQGPEWKGSQNAHASRISAWRRGRKALGEVMGKLGLTDDPIGWEAPGPGLSLAHTDGWAVAVGRVDGGFVGIDLEAADRKVTSGALLRLGTGMEVSDAGGITAGLVLWTALEAVHKARCVEGDLIPGQIRLLPEGPGHGRAEADGKDYRWLALQTERGVVTIAAPMADSVERPAT